MAGVFNFTRMIKSLGLYNVLRNIYVTYILRSSLVSAEDRERDVVVRTWCMRKRQSATTWQHHDARLPHEQSLDVTRRRSNTTDTLHCVFACARCCVGTIVALRWKPAIEQQHMYPPCQSLSGAVQTMLNTAQPLCTCMHL